MALLWAGASGYSVITPVSEASVGVLYERGPNTGLLDGAIEAASVGGAIGAPPSASDHNVTFAVVDVGKRTRAFDDSHHSSGVPPRAVKTQPPNAAAAEGSTIAAVQNATVVMQAGERGFGCVRFPQLHSVGATLWAFAECYNASGDDRARSHDRFVLLLIHFIPDSLAHSAPLLLKRQCDRTLGDHCNAEALGFPARKNAHAFGNVCYKTSGDRGASWGELQRVPVDRSGAVLAQGGPVILHCH